MMASRTVALPRVDVSSDRARRRVPPPRVLPERALLYLYRETFMQMTWLRSA